MADVGRKTDLTDNLLKRIKEGILGGRNLKETAEFCEIDPQKLYNWHYDDYLNIATKIEGWKRDRKLNLADKNIEGILALGISDDKSLKVVADMTKFVKETLEKKYYSKQINTDITTGGKPLPILNINDISTNNSNKEDNPTQEED